MYEDPTPLGPEEAQWYRTVVGTLNYFSTTTRYDISYSVSRLSQFSARPTVSSYRALYRVLRYLRNNPVLYLESAGSVEGPDCIEYYSDASHASDWPYSTKSQTGVMITLNGAPVHWLSTKQVSSTAYSSALAEIYALSEAVRHAQLYAWRCADMQIPVTWPLCIQVDNKQAFSFQKGTCMQSKLRGCVDLRSAWVKELKDASKIVTQQVSSVKQKADVLTKCFPNWLFQQRMKLLRTDRYTRQLAQFAAYCHGG